MHNYPRTMNQLETKKVLLMHASLKDSSASANVEDNSMDAKNNNNPP